MRGAADEPEALGIERRPGKAAIGPEEIGAETLLLGREGRGDQAPALFRRRSSRAAVATWGAVRP